MKTVLYNDACYGTVLEFDPGETRKYAADTAPSVKITLAAPPFSKHTIVLDLDDCDRLLAVVDHAVDPVLDLAEFFESVFHTYRSKRAAQAFIASAPGLTELIR